MLTRKAPVGSVFTSAACEVESRNRNISTSTSFASGFFALLAWARGAAIRGDRPELTVWLVAAGVVLAGQLLFLIYGGSMTEVPDASEYKEFFIALGFAWYAATLSTAAERERPA